MIRTATSKLRTWLLLVAALLVGAIVLGRPELAVIAAPFVFALVVGTIGPTGPVDVAVDLEIHGEHVLEGETITGQMTVTPAIPSVFVDVSLLLADGLQPDHPDHTFTDIDASHPARVKIPIMCRHWGGYGTARIPIRVRQPLGFFRDERVVHIPFSLKVYPTGETLRSLIVPSATDQTVGGLVARTSATGIEFADLRPYHAGDEMRHVNWRASARRGSLWVSARHPERNSDVILFLDTFADIHDGRSGTLDATVRAAAAIAARHLQNHDRVGIIGFGGTLRWLEPGSGRGQLYRIVESLITTSMVFSYAWKDVSIIPPGLVRPQALVIAITPLVDPRGIAAVHDLLWRGFDTAVVDITPEPYMRSPTGHAGGLARRLWRLERRDLLNHLAEAGGAVATWTPEQPLETVIWEVTRFRRHARIRGAR